VIVYLGRFLLSYFIYNPIEQAGWWQYGYKEMVFTVKSNQDRFDKVVVDVPPEYGNPHIFFMYYLGINPLEYNKTVDREDDEKNKVSAVHGFGKYEFREINWPSDRKIQKTLFVGVNKSIPKTDINENEGMRLIKDIKLPDGVTTIFRVVETY
jgi:hypothetical protein